MENTRLTYKFKCFGHEKISAKHVKTLEFTKDPEITDNADCIIGVNATFELQELKKFSKKVKFFCTVIDANGEEITSEFKCIVNPDYSSETELVLRKSKFPSARTFGFNLNRGSNNLDRRSVELLKNPNQEMEVTVVEGWY